MGRIESERKAPEIVEHIMKPFLEGMSEYFDEHLRIHKAHTVMLGETRIIDGGEAREILNALVELERTGVSGLESNPDTDLYMQMEGFVRARAPLAGGKMHMGRSRNDLYACAARLMTRKKLSALLTDLQQLQEAVLAKAHEHRLTVMPGYTHLQHAEPITLGHFLLGFLDALSRDTVRLRAARISTNRDALGASALAGSSFPLDRSRTAELMGFEGLVENSYDAVAARDYLVEASAAAAILASTLARVADSLIVWSTSEFAMIDMPDSYAYTSSIMPQKRNPGYFLESVRAKSARVTGDLTGVLCTLKGTTFAQSRDTSFEITVPAFRAFAEVQGMVNVMQGVVERMIVNGEAMEKNCASEFSGATEIANHLVRGHGLDFRSAYQVVATAVRFANTRQLKPWEMNAVLFDEAAREAIGRSVNLEEKDLRHALQPRTNVQLKVTVGSPAAGPMEAMLAHRRTALVESGQALSREIIALQEADAKLETAMEGLH